MREVVIVEAARSAIGKRNGSLSHLHPVDLLANVQRGLFDRSGIDPAVVGQVVGGCVTQVGRQAANVTRNAWLAAGLPLEVAGTTVDAQCGSSQHATSLAHGLVASGIVDVAVACGVEAMSQVPMGSSYAPGLGTPMESELYGYQWTSQFQGAELIAQRWALNREDLDAFAVQSQQQAAAAWQDGRFDSQIIEVSGCTRDEGMRETSMEGLAGLRTVMGTDDPVVGPAGGLHTAGTASQISDGAAAVLLMTAQRAQEMGVRPLARIVDTCLVGSDPVSMLTGPIPATQHLLKRNDLSMSEVGVVEINEAFASVVLAWQRELDADPDTVNPNGGAIALGHPLGATGCFLITKTVHELQRSGSRYGLITMCCGGGMGTGTLLERC
ncbi:acetyl-CoA C-acyltransferase [Dactylosporangium sucinum]|uniref:Acetyl-CoA acetyltransferase n=1 Tax=Dactylosporangium sucinum TaxID=1424081 RepID=A0A917UG14_9ACTN|nr:acetyl-CoA C-acyltransferase [Dactylosporangium sucinum]GGM82740.1 acetyl-CoA acetyltransferase [Dactylosporangium sucinum]